MKQKKSKTNDISIAKTPVKNEINSAVKQEPFLKFILSGDNRKFLVGGFIIGALYFIVLRIMYPIPLYYSDSFTYIQVARDHQPVSFRPVMYSQIIDFFKKYSDSDFALILGQYFLSVIANLFLFFTFIYFFPFRKLNKLFFFLASVCNPLYLFCSNLVLSDSLFSSLTVIWFTFLIWILYDARWYYSLLQIVLLLLLFKLRYNAIIFPCFTALTLLLSKQPTWRKVFFIGLNFFVIIILIYKVMNTTENITGTRIFSAFGGWQMANNALFVLQEARDIDTASIEDEEVKSLFHFTLNYLDTSKASYDTNISAFYIWDKSSPLKKYMDVYRIKHNYQDYLTLWIALGPLYQKFGQGVILQKPKVYMNRFIKQNVAAYFSAGLEAFDNYASKPDTLPLVVTNYYQYKTNQAGVNHPWVHRFFIHPWQYLFASLNILFILSALTYFISKRYKQMSRLFNKTLLCYSAFYLGNFFFVVALAPSVFRYHIFIVALTFPIIIWLLQQLIKPLNRQN